MPDRPAETVEEFRLRARAWLADNMPRLEHAAAATPEGDDGAWRRARELQRRLWDGGFAGICFPRECGGLGLGVEYQHAFTEESAPYEMPVLLNIPTFSIIGATLAEMANDEQRRRHLPAILRGDEVWVQLLSEPSGGSDLAGSITRADRDGDVWLLNGSKIWSSGAYAADFGLCLARTNWDVPKHRGLTMFIVDLHAPGVQIERIRQVNGSMEFCQEFFDDVVLAADAVVGEVDDGWTVATRLLGHERASVGGASPYVSGRMLAREIEGVSGLGTVKLARELGVGGDRHVRQLVAEARVLDLVGSALVRRLADGIRTGTLTPPHSSLLRLFSGMAFVRKSEIGVAVAGRDAVVASGDGVGGARAVGDLFLSRQASCLGGGSTEMSRNLIAERVLGLPREWAADKDLAYRDVRKSASTRPG